MIKIFTDIPEWLEAFAYANCFCAEDVQSVHASVEGENDGPPWRMVGQLKDGRYFYLEACCDYTGWDCQASGSSHVENTLDDVIKFGCTEEARRALGLDITESEANG